MKIPIFFIKFKEGINKIRAYDFPQSKYKN